MNYMNTILCFSLEQEYTFATYNSYVNLPKNIYIDILQQIKLYNIINAPISIYPSCYISATTQNISFQSHSGFYSDHFHVIECVQGRIKGIFSTEKKGKKEQKMCPKNRKFDPKPAKITCDPKK